MSLSPKAAKFDLFVKGVDPKALQRAAGFLGSLPPTEVKDAEDSILNAAWHCLQATEEENEAPTRPGFANKLQDTHKAARKFFGYLNSISEHVYPIALQYNLLDIEDGDIKREALTYAYPCFEGQGVTTVIAFRGGYKGGVITVGNAW